MRLRTLEIALEGLEGFGKPDARMEQYLTPAPLAARLLHHAHLLGDIEGKAVCDLGCGTGVLACGAILLGATGCGPAYKPLPYVPKADAAPPITACHDGVGDGPRLSLQGPLHGRRRQPWPALPGSDRPAPPIGP